MIDTLIVMGRNVSKLIDRAENRTNRRKPKLRKFRLKGDREGGK